MCWAVPSESLEEKKGEYACEVSAQEIASQSEEWGSQHRGWVWGGLRLFAGCEALVKAVSQDSDVMQESDLMP
jgi:hypothetical protein